METKKERTQITREKFGGKDIIWYMGLHSIDEIITEFKLPVLVKVVDGYMINDIECLETDTILSIHGYRRLEKFSAFDQRDRALNIPSTCKYEVIIRPNSSIPLCQTVGDICKQEKIPQFIMNEVEFQRGRRIFPAHSIFSVKAISMEKNEAKGLEVSCLTGKVGPVTLPVSAVGNFRQSVHPEDMNKRYKMIDLIERNLPLAVEFQPCGDESVTYSPRMGTVRLKKLVVCDVVYATNYENGRRLLITFSRGLNIKLQLGRVMVVEDNLEYSTIAEPVEEEIDDEVLQHTLHHDPYAGDYTNVDYEVVREQLGLTTPKKDTGGQPERATGSETWEEKEQLGTNIPPKVPNRLPPVPSKPSKPPRIPPRSSIKKKEAISVPSPINANEADEYEAISTSNIAVKNKYVPTPTVPPPLPPRSNQSPKPSPKPKQKAPHEDAMVIAWTLPLNEAASFSFPESSERSPKSPRPPMPIPTGKPPSPLKLCENSGPDEDYEEVKFERAPLPLDKSLTEQKSQVRPPTQAYEEISIHRETVPTSPLHGKTATQRKKSMQIDTSLTAQRPMSMVTCQDYEVVTPGEISSPIDTTLTAQCSRGRAPSQSYEEVLMPGEMSLPNEKPLLPQVSEEVKLQQRASVKPYEFTALKTKKGQQTETNIHNSSEKTIVEDDQDNTNEISKELFAKDVAGICDVLEKLQLGEFKDAFIDMQIDGELLGDITEQDLVSDFSMTMFQAKKLCVYMEGWRPDEECEPLNEYIESEAARGSDAAKWRVSDVCERMKEIRLPGFADFCSENQVNGSLLKLILGKDVLDSVRNDHHVSLSNIEAKKLIKCVTARWRPNSVS